MIKSAFSYINLAKKILSVSLYKNLGIGFQMPYKYIFIVTNLCQSRCKTCNIWKIYIDNPEKLKTELTLEEYERIFENIKNDALWLVLSGGEPFIRKDFDEIAILSSEILDKTFLINTPTNALTPKLIEKKTERIIQNIRRNLSYFITISLDGLGHMYEEIRGVDGYDSVIETYERLCELAKAYPNLNVGFQTTVSKLNIDFIKDIFEKIKDTSIPIFTFANENEYFYNIGSNVDMKNFNRGKLLEVIRFLYKNYKIKSLYDIVPKVFLKLAEKFYENPSRQVLPCYASWATLTIDPYGNILPCSYFYRVIDNVRNINFDIKSALLSERAKETRKIIKEHNCPKCWTNCEAFPTMFHNVTGVLRKFFF
jgi:radical SAM protein with 4Fe4S-binding SPASM domain